MTVPVCSKASTVKCIDLEHTNKVGLLFIGVSKRNAACCMSKRTLVRYVEPVEKHAGRQLFVDTIEGSSL